MFKHLRKLLLLAALLVPWATNAQVDTTTVADGTTTNSYVPFYGTWMDENQHNQIIYPASMVSELAGDSIVGMKFYMSSSASSAWGATVTIKLGVTGATTLSSLDNTTPVTQVWTGTVNGTSTIDITFDSAYAFIGGNLLVDITSTSSGEYSPAYFYGVTQSGASYYTYDGSGGPQSFVPKTDFYHVEGDFMSCLPATGLVASSIVEDGFTLSWDPSDDATSYFIYLDGEYVTTQTSDTFYTFTGLDANTYYSAGVRVLCSATDTAMLISIPVKTSCGLLTVLPYEQDFESATTNTSSTQMSINCWTYTTNATSYYYPYVSNYSTYNHTLNGIKGLYWYIGTSSSYGTHQVLALPPVDTNMFSISNLSFHFYARASYTSSHPKFVVGVMSDPTDVSTFVPVDTINVDGTDWIFYGTSPAKFANYQGTGQYVALATGTMFGSTSGTAYVDDIVLTDGWCEMPQNPDYIADTTEITVFWEPNGGTSFTVYLGTDTVYNVTDTFYTFTGLTPNTPYEYGIANECATMTSLFTISDARTACVPIVELPWTETFESAPAGSTSEPLFVPCWTYTVENASYYYPYLTTSTAYNHTPGGNKGLYWYRYMSASSYGSYQCLVLPEFDNELYPINTLEVKFWARASSPVYNPTLVVGAMSDPNDITTFDTIEVVNIGNSATWKVYAVAFDEYDGDGTYMAIRANAVETWYAYVDDVTIEEIPSCTPVYYLSIGAKTATSAIATWSTQNNMPEPTEYLVEYAPTDGTETPTTETVSEQNITMLSLTPSTQYYIKVQAVCDDGSMGTMDSITFTTLAEATCAAPAVMPLFVGSDSVIVNWVPGYDETEWSLDYKLAAEEEWTNAGMGITDMSFELTGLSPASKYQVRVYHECEDTTYAGMTTFHTDCGLLTALPYMEDFESWNITSSSNNLFIPCWHKTNNATSTFYPYLSSSSSYNHTDGGNKGLYWYATTTASYGNNNMIVLPGVNTEVYPVNKLRLTFWAKSSYSSYQPTFIVGAMSDPEDDSTFVGYDTISPGFITTDWTKCVTRFNNFTADTCNYIAIRQYMPMSYWYSYVDDITLDLLPPCENVEDIEVVTSASSAIVSWSSYGNYQGAYVEWRDTNNTWYNTTVYGQNYIVLNDLDMNMPYTVKVTAICGEDTISGEVTTSFTTKGTNCALVNETLTFSDTIGNGTSTSSYFPSYGFYNYSLTQQIYTASEISGAGLINSIAVMPSNFYSTNVRTLEIYLGHTTESSLSNFIHPSDMIKVYEGSPVMTTGQWYTFDFDQAFNYNGSENLLVCFRDMTGSYASSSYFYGHTNPNGNSRYVYQDGGSYDPYTYSGGSSSTFRNNMIFTMSPCDSMGVCAAPAAIITDVDVNTVDVIWAQGNEETSWNLYYRLDGDDTWTTAATGVTDSSYQFTGLQGGTPYEFMVEAVCDQLVGTTLKATTECATISQLPYTEDFNSWGTGSGVIPNCWSRSGTYSTYTYISPSYNHSGNGGGSIYTYAYGSNYSTLILPALDTTVYKVNETELVFYAYAYSTYTGKFIVGVCDDKDDFTTFTPVDTVALTAESGTWQPFAVSLANYSDSGTYIALRTSPTSTYFYNYIDDFTLQLAPPCPRVDSLTTTSATTTSVDLGWNDYSGSTTQWQIEYGPFGFEQGTGTLVTATSNPFTLNNPTCNSGVFYVRPICSTGDTGYWSLTNGVFYLEQTPATIPYNYDFESVTEWNNWQGSYNVLDRVWVRGTAVADSGSYSMYMSTDQGATYTPFYNTPITNSATFRDIDFGTVDTSAELTIRARAGGSTTGNYDGLMVFLADPTVTPIASNASLTTPWGHLNNLDLLAFIRTDTTWQTYQIPIDNVSGVQRLVFFWFNQNTSSSYSPIYEAAAVDNIHIRYTTCVRPTTFTTVNATMNTATVAWNGPANTEYHVIYRPASGTAADNQLTTTNTNQVTLTGLDSLTTYSMWVRKVCGAGDTSFWSDRYRFATLLCNNGAMVENYDGSLSETTTSYGPIGYSYYNYSYVQTIVDSAYMATMGDAAVEYFGFNPTTVTAGSTYYTGMNIYLANVPESDLSSGWILPDDSIHVFEKVLNNGTLNFTETGWQVFQLDTSFVWDGHSNVLVSVVRNHGSYASGPSFSAHSTASKMRYAYRDSDPYNYTNPDVSGTLTAYTGDIRLFSCSALPSCAMPEGVYASNVTYNSATINWTGTASSYEVQYKAGTDADWNTAIETTENSYQLTGLTDSMAYLYQVRSICVDEESGDTTYSDWVDGTFTTLHLPCFAPSALEAQTVTYSTATLNWEENGIATQWNVHVWNTQFDSIYSSTSHTFVVTGLTQTTIYNVAVSAQCNEETESEYSDTITIQTLTCEKPTGLTVTDKTATSVTIVWGGSGIGFDIEYGDEHFSEGVNTQVVHVTGNTYTITGLEPEYDYSVSVRAECEEGVYSAYCAQVDFTTPAQGEGIENAGTANVTLYPNPTSNATTIAISGVNGEVEITLVDLSGRVVMTDSMSCTGDCAKKLEVSGLSQGAYFVRLSGENVNMVKKLIVK